MINKFISFFDVVGVKYLADNFELYTHSFKATLNISKLSLFNQAEYQIINSYFGEYNYTWTLSIEELDYTISQGVFQDITLNGHQDGEEISVELNVYKKGKQVVVFNKTEFYKFINSEKLIDILNQFRTKVDGIQFWDNDCTFVRANSFVGINKDLKNDRRQVITLSAQSTFNNYSDFKYTPGDFYLAENPADNPLLILIEKLQFVFLIVYIFDNTEISGNSLSAKICGYKTIKTELNFETLDISSIDVYRKVFDWVYSEPNRTEDKLGIARNIMSMYIDEKSLNLEPDAFSSMLSANNTYIKGNISKYLETRNRVHDQLEQLSERVNKSLESFYANFQKTIFLFLSFYLSIFVIRTYAKVDTEEVFSQQLTVMALALLALSFIFMLFSIGILELEKKRISAKYADVKERAKDILVVQDIDLLLKNDKEYTSEITFLDNRRNLYILLWLITLGIFSYVLAYTSSYI